MGQESGLEPSLRPSPRPGPSSTSPAPGGWKANCRGLRPTHLPSRSQPTLQQDSQEGDSGQKSHLVLHGADGSVRPGWCVRGLATEFLSASVRWAETGPRTGRVACSPRPFSVEGGWGRDYGLREPGSLVRLSKQQPGPDERTASWGQPSHLLTVILPLLCLALCRQNSSYPARTSAMVCPVSTQALHSQKVPVGPPDLLLSWVWSQESSGSYLSHPLPPLPIYHQVPLILNRPLVPPSKPCPAPSLTWPQVTGSSHVPGPDSPPTCTHPLIWSPFPNFGCLVTCNSAAHPSTQPTLGTAKSLLPFRSPDVCPLTAPWAPCTRAIPKGLLAGLAGWVSPLGMAKPTVSGAPDPETVSCHFYLASIPSS